MTDTTGLIERLRYPCNATSDHLEAADALEAQAREIAALRDALACELDDTRNAIGPLNAEIDRLRAERDEAKEYGTRMRREWQRECEDTNLLLQGLGLCPSEYRSEGGSLLLGRIQHAVKTREARIVAERDEAVALLREAREDLFVYNVAGVLGIPPESLMARLDAFLAKVKP